MRRLWALMAAFCALAQGPKDKEKDEWPALTEDERKWSRPEVHAVLLRREEHTDLEKSLSSHFFRIKILTNEGRKHGDIEIVHARGIAELRDVQARTIQPDGSVVPFQGQIFDKTVARVRKVRVFTKTFSLPDVQVGSILEYRYRLHWKQEPLMHWNVDHSLYTRSARFSLRPHPNAFSEPHWSGRGLGGKRPDNQGGVRILQMADLPPFEREEVMPPEGEVRPHLEFFYPPPTQEVRPVKADAKQMLDDDWTWFAKRVGERLDKFLDKDRPMRDTVAGVTAAADSPESKLRKIYERAQRIRNLTYQLPKTKAAMEKLEDNKNVEDVLRHGYGSESDINLAFVALARAAGFQAWPVLTPERDRTFFSRRDHRWQSLTGELALVQVGTEERFFDPGALYCPFGVVSWEKTGFSGIRLVKGGGLWVEVPVPASADTEVRRALQLHSIERGGLEGELRLVFTGQEALRRRQEARDQDDLGRRKELEEEVKRLLPDGSSVEVRKVGPWEQADRPLEAECHLRIVGIMATTGQRLIVPLSALRVGALPVVHRPARIHPVHVPYRFQENDEVRFQVPAGYEVESLPAARKVENGFARFETAHHAENGEVRLERRETMEGTLFSSTEYALLLSYIRSTRFADEDRTVLHRAAAR